MNRRGFFYRLGGLVGAAFALGTGVAETVRHRFRAASAPPSTAFGALTEEQKRIWAEALWREAKKPSLFLELTKRQRKD